MLIMLGLQKGRILSETEKITYSIYLEEFRRIFELMGIEIYKYNIESFSNGILIYSFFT